MPQAQQRADVRSRAVARLMELARTDPELRALTPLQGITDAVRQPGLSFEEIIDTVLRGYADRPGLYRRAYEIVSAPDGRQTRRYLPAYEAITYDELRQRIEAVASAWRRHPEHRVGVGEFVAIFGFTGIDFTTCDLATVYAQATVAPIQANLPAADVFDVFRDIEPVTLVAAIENLEAVVELARFQGSVRSLIVIDGDLRVDDDRERIAAARAALADRISVISLEELLAFGRTFTFESLPKHPDGEERLVSLMFTSGSTGAPKGAMFVERISRWHWIGNANPIPTIGVGFAPMNHSLGRGQVFAVLAQGGSTYFALKHDMSTLFEDIRRARPTFISLIPRVAELIWHHYQAEMVRRSVGREHELDKIDAEIRADMKANYLGDRYHLSAIGSAPTGPEVLEFISTCFDVVITEGYGNTESGGPIAAGTFIDRRYITDYMLRDVPELGYYTTDKPHPRGELLVKSRIMIPGYYKKPEATRQLYTEDGWLQTGDVMAEIGPDQVVWLDRKNNVLKLSQAEFVAIGPLEAVFESGQALIKQIFLYGNSLRAYLVGVVVPDMEVARSLLGGRTPGDLEVKRMILDGMKETARAVGLKGFEIPRDLMIEHEPFSLENGLLTSVRKPARANLKRRYGDAMEALYASIEKKQRDDLLALRNRDTDLTVLERVGAALEASLGVGNIDLEMAQSFADLGGDSLGAASFALLLEEIFGVPVPVSAIVSPAASPKRWAALIEASQRGGEAAVTVADVHGTDAPKVVKASDLDLNLFLSAHVLKDAEAAAPLADQVKTVFLTGASGYLGRFLCLEWLEALAPKGGKLICVIRGRDPAQARQRLDDAFGTVDAVLAKRFRTLADKHLEVLPGDLAEPDLGLNEADYARLAAEVDLICHPAALVNHVLPYHNLFQPNVLGTAELIRLALTTKRKRFDFISSTAVANLMGEASVAQEDDDVREKCAEVVLSDAYAAGYGASKWAGEVLLREAHDLFGLPVNVYRSDMILGHSRFRGQLNVPDMFSRLLYSMAVTGLAPETFYDRDSEGRRQHTHYDGLPVDFTAATMVELGLQRSTGFRTFNIINFHHDDDVSLDTIADWVTSAGYPLERVADHGRWIERFEQKLRNMPEEQRQHSSLAILSAFARPHPVKTGFVASTSFELALRSLNTGPSVPHITEAFIHKHLDDLRLLGILPFPPSGGSTSHAVSVGVSAGSRD